MLPFAAAALGSKRVHFVRDLTSGGIATVASKIRLQTRVRVTPEEAVLPVRDVCEMLGYDPLYLA